MPLVLIDDMSTALPPPRLFAGLDRQTISAILARVPRRRFAAEQYLCRQGDAGHSLYLIMDGLVEIWLEQGDERSLIARLRPGDAVGEMSLLTGEPRAASVMAAVPTEILELDARTFASVLAEHPVVLRNVALMLIERQKLANEQILLRHERGEALALVMGEKTADLAAQAIAAAERSSRHEVAVVDMTGKIRGPGRVVAAECVADVLGALDPMLAEQWIVIVAVGCRQPDLPILLRELDRAVYLLSEAEARRHKGCIEAGHATTEWILIGRQCEKHTWRPGAPARDLAAGERARPALARPPSGAHQAGAGARGRRRQELCPCRRARGARGRRL
jgi:CRP-like cAMP-binding protein